MINPNLSYDIYNNTHIFGIGGKYHFSKNDFFIDDKNGIIGIYKLNDKLAKTIFGCNEYYAKIYKYTIINNNIIINKNTKVPPINFSFFRKSVIEPESLKPTINLKAINDDYFNLFKIDITDNENKRPINIIDNHIYNTYIYYNYHVNSPTIISNNLINNENKQKLLYAITNNYNLLDTDFNNKTLYFNYNHVYFSNIRIAPYFDNVILYFQGNNVNTDKGIFVSNEDDISNNINNYIIFDVSSHIIPFKDIRYLNNLKELYMDKKFEIYYDNSCNELKYSFDINDLNIKIGDISINDFNKNVNIDSEYRKNDISFTISGWIKNDISINTYIVKNESSLDVSINYICDFSGVIIGNKKDINKYTIFNGMIFNTIDTSNIKINNLDYYEENYRMDIFLNKDSATKYIENKKNNLNTIGHTGYNSLYINQQIFINTNDMSLNKISYDSDFIFINDISTQIVGVSGKQLNLQKYDISFYYLHEGTYQYVGKNPYTKLNKQDQIKIQYNDNHTIFKNSGYIQTNLTEYIDNYNIGNYIVFYDGYEYYYRKNCIDNVSKEVLINEDLHLHINKNTKFEFSRNDINLGYINAIN